MNKQPIFRSREIDSKGQIARMWVTVRFIFFIDPFFVLHGYTAAGDSAVTGGRQTVTSTVF